MTVTGTLNAYHLDKSKKLSPSKLLDYQLRRVCTELSAWISNVPVYSNPRSLRLSRAISIRAGASSALRISMLVAKK